MCVAIPNTYPAQTSQGKPMLTLYSDNRALMNALALIESGNDNSKVGDRSNPDGPAIGIMQIHQHAWDEISELRRKEGSPIHPYQSARIDSIAKAYATTFTQAILDEFKRHHKGRPSPQILYACYSLGPAILPRIKSMTGLVPEFSPFEPTLLVTSGKPYLLLSGIGYSTYLSSRKMAAGERYQNLLYAHHLSLRTLGIPTLW